MSDPFLDCKILKLLGCIQSSTADTAKAAAEGGSSLEPIPELSGKATTGTTMGGGGVTIPDGSTYHVRYIQCLTDSVFTVVTDLTHIGADFTGEVMPAGTLIEGTFTNVIVASGVTRMYFSTNA